MNQYKTRWDLYEILKEAYDEDYRVLAEAITYRLSDQTFKEIFNHINRVEFTNELKTL